MARRLYAGADAGKCAFPQVPGCTQFPTDEKNPDGMYRRQFLRCGLTGTLTALAALAARPARAQDFPKSTKEQAGYVDQSTDHPCIDCTLFPRAQ